jgi:hypothetical protein
MGYFPIYRPLGSCAATWYESFLKLREALEEISEMILTYVVLRLK